MINKHRCNKASQVEPDRDRDREQRTWARGRKGCVRVRVFVRGLHARAAAVVVRFAIDVDRRRWRVKTQNAHVVHVLDG